MTNTLVNESRLNRNPNYKIMDLSQEDLMIELQIWQRSKLIDWLCWNDKNGIYDDAQSKKEFGNVLQKNDAIKIILKQIFN